MFVDPEGEDIYVFDNEGNYVNTTEADGEDYIQWNTVNSDGNSQVMQISFVDPINDPQNINADTKLKIISDATISDALNRSGAMNSNNHGLIVGCKYLLKESNANNLFGEGKLDFTGSGKYNIDPESVLYVVTTGNNHVAHNGYNFGNFLWGASTKLLGIPTFVARIGAHINNFFNDTISRYHLDSKDDQRSIQMGADWVRQHKNK